jgi:proteasome lid subunit RPN8/RPN11
VKSLKELFDMLFIDQIAGRQMIEDASATFPDECCGFMFGREEGEDRFVSEISTVKNAKEGDKKRRYEISAKDYLKAEQYAALNDLLILGVYHSHPNHPAIASETDRQAAQPWFSYLILSVIEGKFDNWRSWRLNEAEQFDEEKINQEINIQQF